MNTKINNWFIHPDYKEENGIYNQCADYNTYQNLFELDQIYYNKNKLLGYCNDEMDIFLIHNENYNSDGDENGYFDPEETNDKEFSDGLFDEEDDNIIIYDKSGNYYYDGSGAGVGCGFLDGGSMF